jgi:hypothetical protein
MCRDIEREVTSHEELITEIWQWVGCSMTLTKAITKNRHAPRSPPFHSSALKNSEFYSEFYSYLFCLNFVKRKKSEKKL